MTAHSSATRNIMTNKLSSFPTQSISEAISALWDQEITPALMDYIKIPNKSPLFDAQWKEHGFMDEAMQLITRWCQHQPLKNMTMEVVQLPNRTPLLFIEIPGEIDETV